MHNSEREAQVNDEQEIADFKTLIIQTYREELFTEIARVASVPEKPDASWARYIFSSEFAEHRHKKGMINGRARSAMSILFDVMTTAERQSVMSGIYNLGNGLSIPKPYRSYAALNRFVGYEDNPKGLKPLRDSINRISSVSFSLHLQHDPDIALKVMALLHRYKTGRDGSLKVAHLAQLLQLPENKRPSLAINEWEAATEAQEISWVIDELIVHLESELDQQCRNSVRDLVTLLTYDMGIAGATISQSIKQQSKGSMKIACQLLENAIKGVDQLKPKSDYVRETAYRLDLDILLYLHRLQIVHRNAADAEITTQLSLQELPVVNILEAIIEFSDRFEASSAQIIEKQKAQNKGKKCAFIDHWQSELKSLMQLAFKREITLEEFEKARKLALAFEDNSEDLLNPPALLGPDILASLCVAYADVIMPFRYTPFWHGQKTQAGNAFHPISNGREFNREDIPEEKFVFWRECKRWIKAGLVGRAPYWNLERNLHDRISDIISESLATHDVTFISSVCLRIRNYADAQAVLTT